MTLANCFCIPRDMKSLPNRALKNKRNRNKIELNYDDAYEVPKLKKWKQMTKEDKLDFLDNDIKEYFLQEEQRDNLYSPMNLLMFSTVIGTNIMLSLYLFLKLFF